MVYVYPIATEAVQANVHRSGRQSCNGSRILEYEDQTNIELELKQECFFNLRSSFYPTTKGRVFMYIMCQINIVNLKLSIIELLYFSCWRPMWHIHNSLAWGLRIPEY